VNPDRTVAFIQEWLPRYRLPFFNLLRDLLAAQRIELRLYYGQPVEAIRRRRTPVGAPGRQHPPRTPRMAAHVAASPAS
jgi:hypothetical protein